MGVAQELHQFFHKGPDGRLQPFVVENAHIQRLMPIFYGDACYLRMYTGAFFPHKADARAGSYKIQCRLGGVDGTDDVLLAAAAGPLAEAVFYIIIEDDLGGGRQLLGRKGVAGSKRVIFGKGDL